MSSFGRDTPRTRSFDSRAQVAQTCVVKSVTILSKMLDKALILKDKLPDLTKSPDSNLDYLQMELDTLINDGMEANETMSFASYEVNARRKECIKTWLKWGLHVTFLSISAHQPIPLWGRHIKATRGDWEDKQSCTKGYGSTQSIPKAASLQEWGLEQI